MKKGFVGHVGMVIKDRVIAIRPTQKLSRSVKIVANVNRRDQQKVDQSIDQYMNKNKKEKMNLEKLGNLDCYRFEHQALETLDKAISSESED